jgi:ribosomal protein L14E/L6E/L27E
MTENLRGCFARSKAGHDKLTLYVVVDFDDEYVWVADGRLKTVDKPKKKKRKHVQLTGITAINIEEKIKENAKIADEDVRRAIKIKLNAKS